MARSVILGNGSLTVGLNEIGLVNDFYYPYVGLDNLNTSRSMHHRVGVWVDGQFSWTDTSDWHCEVGIDDGALVADVRMLNEQLQIELNFSDFVDWDINLFGRRIEVCNLADKPRTIRVFMHQVFEISRRGRADTALYEPDEHYLLDYKGRCSLIISGQHQDGSLFDQYSVGNFAIEGKEGTYKDAEDGELSGNAVEHGGVDSVLRFSSSIAAGESDQIDYWIIAADGQYVAEKLHDQVKDKGLSDRLKLTRQRWADWLSTADHKLSKLHGEERAVVHRSLMTIKAHCDKRGGIIASCDSSIYNFGRDYYSYVWPRDGAYAIWPLIRLGYRDVPKRFFEFCRDIMHPDGYLMHKYQPDRAIGSTWHPLVHGRHSELPIQEDETASVLVMIGEYLKHSGDKDFVFSLYTTFVQPAANFMTDFIDEQTNLPHASYDLWEEKFLTTTYTTAVTYRALLVAKELADEFDYPDDTARWHEAAERLAQHGDTFFNEERKLLRKGFLVRDNGTPRYDDVLDISSLYGAWKFGYYPHDDYIKQTVEQVEAILLDKSPTGGSPRYENDNYFASRPAYMGNPWFVTTLWLAQYYTANNRRKDATRLLDWTLKLALPSGVLSEQVEPSSGAPISVTPLVWSHAEVIHTILDLSDIDQPSTKPTE